MLDLPLYDDQAGKKLKLSNLYALSHRIEEDIKKKNNQTTKNIETADGVIKDFDGPFSK